MINSSQKGSAILDAIIAIALFGVLFTGFLALMQLGIKTVTDHKSRAGALAVARSSIENIHSLEYSSVGVHGGNPSGNLQAVDTESINGVIYTINTTVTWHDDIADGIGGGDSNSHDYKNVHVYVTWPEHAGKSGSVTLSTFIADFEIE